MFYKILKGDKAPVSTVLGTYGIKSKEFTYKIGEVNVDPTFDEHTQHGNGLYFADEKNILNFLGYGDTLYEVELPKDAKIIEINDECNEYKTDKIILKNPKPITPELVKEFLANGSTVQDAKIVGTLEDLFNNRQQELFSIIFDLIDENNPELAYRLFMLDAKAYYNDYINKYSKTTDPETISTIKNTYAYNKQYLQQDSYVEKIILRNIEKNTGKTIDKILNDFYNSLEKSQEER